MQNNNSGNVKLLEIAGRVRDMREISGYTEEQMAALVKVSVEDYKKYESGTVDFPFSFLHSCAQAFGIEMNDLLEGSSPLLSSYTVTRRGQGQATAKEDGIEICNLAPKFNKKLAEPYWVRYEYSDSHR